ncbi:unnamed protein product, partial [marine sediment metagenome]
MRGGREGGWFHAVHGGERKGQRDEEEEEEEGENNTEVWREVL